MPDFYAHYSHGQKIFSLLPKKTALAISNKNLYNLGLQGPDFLYFYHPFKKENNPVLQLASDIHKMHCSVFLTKVLQKTEVIPGTDEFSYLMGFIGHFCLDSSAHPYINKTVRKLNFDHAEMEIEFDKFLLIKDCLPPLKYKAYKHISITEKEAEAVAKIYSSILSSIKLENILYSFLSFKRGKRFFYSPNSLSQNLLFALLKLTCLYTSLQGHIMKKKSNPKSVITNKELLILFDGSIKIGVNLMNNFYEHLEENIPLLDGFNCSFE
ncbi:zinc dependent phospholipase C family protein [Treponema pedis]|uniref:zinc dependent phospholipase C family protein n=1 Tax=Treponema pedis TaxID=409322 RepID=UPI00041E4721|nr:zinc dependent phospholipase C family protein [Treponema pedis]QSI05122.1 hypothetical protein DYQ05_09460 [Treponema pedis]